MVTRACISINNRCNLNCTYCHFHEKKDYIQEDNMDVITILDIITSHIEDNDIDLFKLGFVGNGEPMLDYEKLKPIDENRPELSLQEKEEVEIQVKYEGYIKMQEAQVEKFKKLETKLLPEELDYETIQGLSLEARQKLNKFKPHSIGQASRISGVSPADISVLLIYLQVNKKNV